MQGRKQVFGMINNINPLVQVSIVARIKVATLGWPPPEKQIAVPDYLGRETGPAKYGDQPVKEDTR